MTATGLVFGYLMISLLMLKVPRYLNGSILYAPTMIVLLGLAVYHYTSRQPDRQQGRQQRAPDPYPADDFDDDIPF